MAKFSHCRSWLLPPTAAIHRRHFSSITSHSQVKAKTKEHAAHSREAREPDHSFLSSKRAELVTIQSY
jgi:hypothetical protein